MTFAQTIGSARYTFSSLRELFAKATPQRSGEGLSYREAARQVVNCLVTAKQRGPTGTALPEPTTLPEENNTTGGQP